MNLVLLSLVISLWINSIQAFERFQIRNAAANRRCPVAIRSNVPESQRDYFNRPGPWDDRNLDTLLQANKAWRSRMELENPNFFEDQKKGHFPKILWIGCSDARVPANELIGESPGSVFIHRNIANMVVNTDFNCMSVIQYAVDVLQVKHIIVCGHYDCGGIRAALEQIDHKSPLENWLRNIRDTYRLHKNELNAISDPKLRQRRLVEINTVEQTLNIFKTAVVQRRRVKTFQAQENGSKEFLFTQPRVHAFVFDPATGEAKRLDVDFSAYLKDLREVYDLYKPDPASSPPNDTTFSSSLATAPPTPVIASLTANIPVAPSVPVPIPAPAPTPVSVSVSEIAALEVVAPSLNSDSIVLSRKKLLSISAAAVVLFLLRAVL